MSTDGHALLLDDGAGHAALAAARELAAAGWTVGVGTPAGAPTVLARSRAVRRRHAVPHPGEGVEPLRVSVDALAGRWGYDVVLGAGDDWIGALAELHDQVRPAVAHPPAAVVARSLDKLEIVRLGAQVGLRVPHTVAARDDVADDWEGPAVVKSRTHWVPGRVGARSEAVLVTTPAELAGAVARARSSGGDVVLQEPVAGDLAGLVGLFHEGRWVQVSQQSAPRVWPRPTGVTAFGVTVDPDPTLVELTQRFLAELGWAGPVQLEFIQDGSGGPPALIDVNGRVHGSLALAQAAGLRPVADWCRWLVTGDRPVPRPARAGVTYRWLEGDVRSSLAAGTSLPGLLSKLVRQRAATGPLWRWRDPVPALMAAVSLAARIVGAGVAR